MAVGALTVAVQWLGLLALAPAAAADRRTQTVPRALWTVPFLLGGLLVVLLASSLSVAVIGRILVSLVVVGGGGFLLAHTGVIGGADGFAALAIALLYPVAGALPLPAGGLTLPVYAPIAGLLSVTVLVNLAVIAPLYYGVRRLTGATESARGGVPYIVAVWWAVLVSLTLGPVTGVPP